MLFAIGNPNLVGDIVDLGHLLLLDVVSSASGFMSSIFTISLEVFCVIPSSEFVLEEGNSLLCCVAPGANTFAALVAACESSDVNSGVNIGDAGRSGCPGSLKMVVLFSQGGCELLSFSSTARSP